MIREKYKIFTKRDWLDRQYHVQDNADVANKDIKMYSENKKSPTLPFCGLHTKSHGARGLSKHYCLCFDPKLGHGICAIFCIPYAYVACLTNLVFVV